MVTAGSRSKPFSCLWIKCSPLLKDNFAIGLEDYASVNIHL
jgi:hypothetical protein